MYRRAPIIGTALTLIMFGLGAAGRSGPREGIEAANVEFSAAVRRSDAGAVAAMYTEARATVPTE